MKIGLNAMILQYLERLPEERRESELHSIVWSIKRAIEDIERLPDGPTRARVIHQRIDKALEVFWKHDPKTKAGISCFNCTSGGCCHTNVDITEDEAQLYANLITEGKIQIDPERLELQASVSDNRENQENEDAWGALSYEQRKCVFLDSNNRCSIYENRPHVCRKWFAVNTDPKICEDYRGRPLVQAAINVEVISAAIFTRLTSGRLARMLKKALDEKKKV